MTFSLDEFCAIEGTYTHHLPVSAQVLHSHLPCQHAQPWRAQFAEPFMAVSSHLYPPTHNIVPAPHDVSTYRILLSFQNLVCVFLLSGQMSLHIFTPFTRFDLTCIMFHESILSAPVSLLRSWFCGLKLFTFPKRPFPCNPEDSLPASASSMELLIDV